MASICEGLAFIHESDLIHKDLHVGNVILDYVNNFADACICDFGFCKPADEILSNDKKVYGVMPYMAPEILRGKEYTQKADIYSLGIIINEIISMTPPFNKEPHDHYLTLDICRGKRPEIRKEVPDCLKEIIQKCWDANPTNRPTSIEVEVMLWDFSCVKDENGVHDIDEFTEHCREFEMIYLSNSIEESTTITSSLLKMRLETHPHAIYTSRLLQLPNLPEPINCPNQQDFVSSRPIMQVVQAEAANTAHSDCMDCV
ncbi:kinase-like domain-containing protein, partial [Glomus cerebriforme]